MSWRIWTRFLAQAPASTTAANDDARGQRKLALASNAFGLDLYRRLRSAKGNLAFSPASLTTALAMVYGGARGETASELERVLHLDGPAGDVLGAAGELASALQDSRRPGILRIANRLYGEQTCRFLPAYLEAMGTTFGAPLEPVDFRRAPEPARQRINAWVEERTEHRIEGLIPPHGIQPEARLVVVNAVYFLGDWEQPFDPRLTMPMPFHLSTGASRDVPTMHLQGEFAFVERRRLKALALPYLGGGMSMLLVLPKDGLAEVEGTLTASALDALVKSLARQRVRVALPRFEVNPPSSLALGGILREMGLQRATDPAQADFAGMADPTGPDRLFLGAVFHKAFVHVDEKGTEAAAATAALVEVTAARRVPKVAQFIADRPFLYFIRDEASGMVLFQGRVAEP